MGQGYHNSLESRKPEQVIYQRFVLLSMPSSSYINESFQRSATAFVRGKMTGDIATLSVSRYIYTHTTFRAKMFRMASEQMYIRWHQLRLSAFMYDKIFANQFCLSSYNYECTQQYAYLSDYINTGCCRPGEWVPAERDTGT